MVVQRQRRPGDQAFWPKVVLKKWLNLRSRDSEFSADAEDDDGGGEVDERESCGCDDGEDSRQANGGAEIAGGDDPESAPYRLRRRNSETLRAQYIDTKELRICVGTYNAAGVAPPDDLDIAEWLELDAGGEPADMYVLGFQEVVPLNAGNVFGAEDGGPAMAWEELIRDTLRRAQPARPRYRYHSHPASPSRLDPPDGSDGLLPIPIPGADADDTDANTDDDAAFSFPVQPEQLIAATPRRLTRLDLFGGPDDSDGDEQDEQPPAVLLKTLSITDRIGLAWPERPLNMAPSFKSSSRSFAAYRASFRGSRSGVTAAAAAADLDLDAAASKKSSRPPFVRIVSKQMVGIFLTIWVRRGLRKCVRNLSVSTVGVGAMGYIGNKGAVSASMSIYQTMFCFVCTHLAAGERPGDLHKRNADVQEIHRRTHFAHPGGDPELHPRGIYDHERIFWLGDLNYRIDVPYEKAHDLISSMEWAQLAERDQLTRELKKGRAFDGWSEGVLQFAPTYKYEPNSAKYIGDDQRGGRRTPAWCDRVLSFGKGARLLGYKRSEMRMSDHRPVAATYAAEVEVFCGRKLQRALTLTDAEVEGGQVVPDLGF